MVLKLISHAAEQVGLFMRCNHNVVVVLVDQFFQSSQIGDWVGRRKRASVPMPDKRAETTLAESGRIHDVDRVPAAKAMQRLAS